MPSQHPRARRTREAAPRGSRRGLPAPRDPAGRRAGQPATAKTARLSRLRTRRSVARSLADRPAAAVRPRAEVPAEEHRPRAGLLGVRGDQPADAARPIAWPSAASELGVNYCSCPDFAVNTLGTCKHIEFILARLRRKRGAAGRLRRAASSRPTRRSTCATGPSARCMFRPGRTARLASVDWPDGTSTPTACSGRRASTDSTCSWSRSRPAAPAGTRCAATTTPWPSSPRSATARNWSGAIDAAFPDGRRDKAFDDLLKVPLYPVPAPGGAVRRPGRAVPHRRRHGPGQDHPGHRRRGDPGPRRRASSACWSSAPPR